LTRPLRCFPSQLSCCGSTDGNRRRHWTCPGRSRPVHFGRVPSVSIGTR